MDSSAYSPPRVPSQDGETAQSTFVQTLNAVASYRADFGKLEGLIYWSYADDPGYNGIQFQESGVVDTSLNEKLAADRIRTDWAVWN